MNHRSTRFLSLATSTLAFGLLASGFANAEPVAPVTPPSELAPAPTEPTEPELVSWPAPGPDEATPATDYQCVAQCWRDFVDCLGNPDCSEEFCQEQQDICVSFC